MKIAIVVLALATIPCDAFSPMAAGRIGVAPSHSWGPPDLYRPTATVLGRRAACGPKMSIAGIQTTLMLALKPAWWVYQFQNLAVSNIVNQVVVVTLLSFILISGGAFIYALVVPNSLSKNVIHWLTRSYVMLNKVGAEPDPPSVSHAKRKPGVPVCTPVATNKMETWS